MEQTRDPSAITSSETDLRIIFDNSPYAMLIITDGVFVEANEAAYRIFKARRREDIIGKPPAILSPPIQPDGISSDESALEKIKSALAGAHEVFEWQHQRLNGEPFFAMVNLKAFPYLGKPSLMVAFEDITDQKARNEEIRLAKQNMQTIYDSTPYAMLVITEGVFVEANSAAVRLFKAGSKDNIIGNPPAILSPHTQMDGITSDKAAMIHIERAISGTLESFDWIHQKFDGSLMDCHVTLAGIDYNGKPSLMTVIQDLTAQRQQQKEIQIAQKNMQTIFDTTPYALLVITDGVFVGANAAAITLFGARTSDAIIGKPPSILSPPEQDDGTSSDTGALSHIQKAVAGHVETFDWIHQKLDGTRMDCYVTLAGIEYNGKPSLMTVIQDLTGQRKQQREILFLKERADLIIEKNPALMFVLDTHLKVIKINQAWAEVSGYTKEKLLSMNISDFDVTDRMGGSAKDVLTTKNQTSGTIRLKAPRGTLYLRYFYIPMLDQNGKIESILAVYFDETSLKNLQIRLDASIAEVGRVLSLLAQKNLTGQAAIEPDDPLLRVKEDLNRTVIDLRKILSEIMTDSKSLLSSIKDINRSTDDLAHASNDVADTSQYAADEITRQREQLDSISRDVSDLSASIEEIAASAADVRDITRKVADNGAKAQEQGEDANRQMKVVEEISGAAVEQIRNLNNQMQEIGKIVKLISDIASQTNLLALNAAIEAARAGDAGRGFAVVAGEVKNLAGESRQATSNIEEVISRLIAGSTQTAESIERSYTTIVAGIKAVHETIESLNQMVSDIDTASGNVTEISRATDSQAEATNRVNQNIEAVSQMVSANQDKMDSLSANAEESSAATEEIASASSMIVEMVEKLQLKIGDFSV
ncbi:MAG TPA: methyl-accepting chemotaxis protein [Methanospirillum sp.]|nr:methyl-accepting chemotaxis protein [Methanospirillum sp.]